MGLGLNGRRSHADVRFPADMRKCIHLHIHMHAYMHIHAHVTHTHVHIYPSMRTPTRAQSSRCMPLSNPVSAWLSFQPGGRRARPSRGARRKSELRRCVLLRRGSSLRDMTFRSFDIWPLSCKDTCLLWNCVAFAKVVFFAKVRFHNILRTPLAA